MTGSDPTPEEDREFEQKRLLALQEREAKFKPTAHFSRYAIVGAVLILVILFLTGVIPRFYLNKKNEEAAEKNSSPLVTFIEAKGINAPIELVLPSSLDAIHTTPLWARVDGYIRTFVVDIGDFVSKGDLIAEIETPELDQQYEQARANLASAQSQLKISKVTSDRWNRLYQLNSEAIAKQEVDQRVADFETAEAQVLLAEANVRRLEKTLEFKRIIAPFDGVITERNIDLGSLITAGSANNPQQLFKIAKTNILRVFVNVPQTFFRLIKNDLIVDVIISQYPGKVFKGFVKRFAKALDPIARTLLTEVHIHNPDHELYVGTYADVKFLLQPETTYYIVPASAILIRGDGPTVALLDENNIVQIKPVTLGLDHGKTMEIVTGVHEHDRIITNPSDKIIEGIKVRVASDKIQR